jgi:hypothetical protein
MNWQSGFRVAIRIVFLFAFIAFLSASISHVATFFNDFEADKGNWIEPYMLAISIDLTALVLTIGVMFFRKEMPWYAVVITWAFIIGLTAFSWTVNFEYAQTYQGNLIHTNPILTTLNPILASSFAFFNLVYSFVSEFFGMKQKTAVELLAEADRLEALEEAQKRIDAYRDRNRKSSLIQRAKETLIEAKEAVIELKNGSDEEVESSPKTEVTIEPDVEVLEEVTEEVSSQEYGSDEEVETDPEVEVLNVVPFHQNGNSDFPKTSIKGKIARRKLFTIAEAAKELECTPRHVRELRKKEVLATDDSGLITAASLRSYAAKRRAKTVELNG